MARVFLSHAAPDKPLAKTVEQWLEADGNDVFIDTDIPVGDAWRADLFDQLKQADAIVCVVTDSYVESKWCFAEIAIAQSLGCLLIPIRTSTDVAHPLLNEHQYTSEDTETAREQLFSKLRALDSRGAERWTPGRNPYPGLVPYTAELESIFFGRDQETGDVVQLVRANATDSIVVIAGPSGCGKSSLMRAGIIPALAADQDWLTIEPCLPGEDPIHGLAKAISATAIRAGLSLTADEVASRLQCHGLRDVLDDVKLNLPGHRPRSTLISIDQTEDLFGREVPESSRARFVELIASLPPEQYAVICSVRTEYLDDLRSCLEPVGRLLRAHVLGQIAPGRLRDVISGPAKVAGIQIEDGLVDRLVADTASGDALPYLAFTLHLLADGVGRGGRLAPKDYDYLGSQFGYADLEGVHAILVGRADTALELACRQSGLDEGAVLDGLTRFADIDDLGRWIRRTVSIDDISETMNDAISVFVSFRLLTHDESGGGVRFIHDALLMSWPSLTTAIERHGSALKMARSVEQAAAEWSQNGYLWPEERLVAADRELGDRSSGYRDWRIVTLGQRAADFLEASRIEVNRVHRRQRFRRVRAQVALSVLLVLSVVAGLVAAAQGGEARKERDAATARGLIARSDAERATNPELALQLDLAANAIDPTDEVTASLVRSVTTNNYASTLVGHTSSVFSVAFSPDGTILASGDGSDQLVRLWDVRDARHPRPLSTPMAGHSNFVRAVAFSPDGKLLATGSTAETIIWDVTRPAEPVAIQTLPAPNSATYADSVTLSFNQQGTALATTFGGQVRVWSVSRGQSAPIGPNSTLVASFSDGDVFSTFSGDGSALAYAGPYSGGQGSLVGVASVSSYGGVGSTSSTYVQGTVTAIAAAPTGSLLAVSTSSSDRGESDSANSVQVALWNLNQSGPPSQTSQPMIGQSGEIKGLAFSADSSTLATASNDHTVVLWSVGNSTSPQRVGEPLADHTNSVYAAAFSRSGVLATASSDNTIRLWAPSSVVQPRRLDSGKLQVPSSTRTDGRSDISFSPDGATVAAVSPAGVVFAWGISNRGEPVGPTRLPSDVGLVSSLRFSPTEPVLAVGSTAGSERSVTLWDLTDPAHVVRHGPPLAGHRYDIVSLQFSQDGATLWSGDEAVHLMRWDVSDPDRPSMVSDMLRERKVASTPLIAFRPDGGAIASPDSLPDAYTHFAVIRDISDPDHVVRLQNPMQDNDTVTISFGPTGNLLATGGNDVLLWDISTPQLPRRLGQPLGINQCSDSTDENKRCVSALAISPDGHEIAVGERHGSVSVWDITDPARPQQLGRKFDRSGATDAVTGLAFSADDRTLGSIDSTGHIALWDLGPLQDLRMNLISAACERARQGFNADEWRRYVGVDQPYRPTCS